MKRYTITLLSLLTGAAAHSQSTPFLNAYSDARTVAMGDAGYALPAACATHYNSAAMLYAEAKTAAAVSYAQWQPQATAGALLNAGAYTTLGTRAGVAVGLRRHAPAGITRTDAQGNATGAFTPHEYALDAGFAYKIIPQLAAAVTLRYIASDMGAPEKGSAFAADVALLYRRNSLTVGLGYANMGSKIDYGYAAYDLPSRVRAGVAYRLSLSGEHHVTGSVEAAYHTPSGYAGPAAGLGVEYAYRQWGALRAGYHMADETHVGASYASLGGGVRFHGFTLDVAYLVAGSDSPARQSLVLTLGAAYLK
jgi:hypothetical protein